MHKVNPHVLCVLPSGFSFSFLLLKFCQVARRSVTYGFWKCNKTCQQKDSWCEVVVAFLSLSQNKWVLIDASNVQHFGPTFCL